MTDLQQLLAAVLADPGDDLARLAYADASEEAGDLERAEFIRLDLLPEDCERVRSLWDKNRDAWFGDVETCRSPEYFRLGGSPLHRDRAARDAALIGLVERGFVSRLRAPLQVLLECLPAALLAHPITQLHVTDKQPSPLRYGHFCWHKLGSVHHQGDPSCLPVELWDLLPGSGESNQWVSANEQYATDCLHAAVFLYAGRKKRELRASGGPHGPAPRDR